MKNYVSPMPFRSLAALILCLPAIAADQAPTLDAAMERLYNFDFQATHQALNRYIEVHPSEALPHAFRASVYLFYELDRLGALESEFLTDDDRLVEKKGLQPDPGIRSQFQQALAGAESRAATQLKINPDDRGALFALCVVNGISTDYMALVEKRQMRSLTPAKKANGYAQRLLKLDPRFYDAYLTSGFSEYMIGSLPFFIRWFVHFDNVEGNQKRAIEHLELVSREGHYLKPLAKVFLAIIDLREKKPREAQRLLGELAHDYPANPLYRKELEKLNLRFGSLQAPVEHGISPVFVPPFTVLRYHHSYSCLGGCVFACLAGALPARAQAPGEVRGSVVDARGGQALARVEVLLAGTAFRTATDDAGNFRLTAIARG